MNKIDSTANENYRVESFTSIEQLKSLRKFWELSQYYPSADFDFFSLIVQVRNNVMSPCVLILFRNNEPIALLAGRIQKEYIAIRFGYIRLIKIPVRQLIFVSGGFMGERNDANLTRLLRFMKDLLRNMRLDMAVFENLKVGSLELEVLSQIFKGPLRCFTLGESKHWLLKITNNWDAFLMARSKKHRYWLKRLPKVLDREYGEEWKIKIYTQPHEVRDFVINADIVAAKTYQRALGVGFRHDLETLQRIELDASRARLRGYILFIKNEPKAFWYCFIYNGTIYSAATGYDPNYRSFELGTILLMKIFQDSCETESDVIDFGEGDADYKQRFGTFLFTETTCCVPSTSVHSFYLCSLIKLTSFATQISKVILSRLNLLQSIKTSWRKSLIEKNNVIRF